MGFYGKVINYLSKAFSKIKVNNKTLQADSYDDALEFTGDEWIKLSADEQTKLISINHEELELVPELSASISNEDISSENASTILLTLPTFDDAGHAIGSAQHGILVNIDTEKAKRAEEDEKLSERIGFASNGTTPASGLTAQVEQNAANLIAEQERAEAAEAALSERIGYASNDAEQASGVYIPIEANTTAIMAEKTRATKAEEELSARIGKPASGAEVATGVYEYVDEVKESILGSGELQDTLDTLVEIGDWITTHGVEATDLAKALAQETITRANEDGELWRAIDILNAAEDTEKSVRWIIDEKTADIRLLSTENKTAIKNLTKDLASTNEVLSVTEQKLKDQDAAQLELINSLQQTDAEHSQTIADINSNINVIEETYETKTDAQVKLELANAYTDTELGKLQLEVSPTPNRYISNISQSNGLITPVYQDLPFDYPKAINLEYNEEEGDLSFPSYFKVFATGEAPAVVYVYDGGEI